MLPFLRRTLLLPVVATASLALAACTPFQRKMLYFPSHRNVTNGLTPWNVDGETIGLVRPVPSPRQVWLLLHGNAGQAADRVYALPHFAAGDAVYILEYPGYGQRPGTPSRESFNAAAAAAYRRLRESHPSTPIGVVGESIGSGPASSLARERVPPDKIILVVPFDTLLSVASEHFRYLPVGLILRDKWDNISALENYGGPLEIFAAERDTVIPIAHARRLAESKPGTAFHVLRGGHNDWSEDPSVQFRM